MKATITSLYNKSLYNLKDSNANDDNYNTLFPFLQINNSMNHTSSFNNQHTLNKTNKKKDKIRTQTDFCKFLPKRLVNIQAKDITELNCEINSKKSEFYKTVNDINNINTAYNTKIGFNNNSTIQSTTNMNKTNHELEQLHQSYFINKTNFILKFGKTPVIYQKISSLIERISDKNKATLSQTIYKIKCLSEKRDKILINSDKLPKENQSNEEFLKENLENWNQMMPITLDQELSWLKITDICLAEMKELYEQVLHQTKQLNEKNSILNTRENEINYLNKYIKEHDISYKALIIKKNNDQVNELTDVYKNKEKLNLIEKINMEEQIKELVTLLENEKKNIVSYSELKETLDLKSKEIEDLKFKLYQESEEKKMKITYLSNERQDLQNELDSFQDNLLQMRVLIDDNNKKDIIFNTKIKLLKKEIERGERIIAMSQEEINTLINLYYKEKQLHHETKSILMNMQERLFSDNSNNRKSTSVMNVNKIRKNIF